MKTFLILCAISLGSSLAVFAQGTFDERGVYHPTEEQLAANKRLRELLKHPTFVTLRLLSNPRDMPREEPTDSPAPYKVKDWIGFQLRITQNSPEKIVIWNNMSPYYEYRPQLTKDGEVLPYAKVAQESVELADKEPPSGSSAPLTLVPGQEHAWTRVNLEDWYDSLDPGRYQLIVRKRFALDGDWVESNPVFFQVEARNPSPIPAGVKIEIVPAGLPEGQRAKPYAMGSDVQVTVVAVNDSEYRIKVEVVDNYYGDTPQLFKDGRLIPYREDASSLIRHKNENLASVGVTASLFLEPHTKNPLESFNLSSWYGRLSAGSYKLTNRHRFEIEGPWTEDSQPIYFEVAPKTSPQVRR